MSEENIRFTTWLSPREKEGLDRLAKEHGTSVNFIVRMAIRELLGLSTVSVVTRNNDSDATVAS